MILLIDLLWSQHSRNLFFSLLASPCWVGHDDYSSRVCARVGVYLIYHSQMKTQHQTTVLFFSLNLPCKFTKTLNLDANIVLSLSKRSVLPVLKRSHRSCGSLQMLHFHACYFPAVSGFTHRHIFFKKRAVSVRLLSCYFTVFDFCIIIYVM